VETLGHYADERGWITFNGEAFSDDPGISAESPLPGTETHYKNGWRVRLAIARNHASAKERRYSIELERIRRDVAVFKLIALCSKLNQRNSAVPADDFFEDVIVFAQVFHVGPADPQLTAEFGVPPRSASPAPQVAAHPALRRR